MGITRKNTEKGRNCELKGLVESHCLLLKRRWKKTEAQVSQLCGQIRVGGGGTVEPLRLFRKKVGWVHPNKQ